MTIADATQEGVLNPEAETAEREPTARELAMDAIASQRDQTMAAEIGQQLDAPAAAEPETKPADEVVDQVAAQMDEPTVLTDGLDKVMVRIKVDGVERDVSVAEMQRSFQKGSAADQRLEQATRLLREAEARAAAPPVGFVPAPKESDIQATPEDANQKAKSIYSALVEGDEEKAIAAINQMLAGRQPEPTPLDQLTAQLTPAIKQQLSNDIALEKFRTDYADILSDPYLPTLADQFLAEEEKSGKSFSEALDTAGKRTRDWLTSKGVSTAAPTPTSARESKLERKAGIDSIPALNTVATVVEEPVQSATDVINEMRKARGLAA